MAIPPGSYTRETLPPISSEAQKILDQVKARAEEREKQPLTRNNTCPDELGSALGADGYS